MVVRLCYLLLTLKLSVSKNFVILLSCIISWDLGFTSQPRSPAPRKVPVSSWRKRRP